MKASLRTVNDHGVTYTALMFVCPGCESEPGHGGLHMPPVNTDQKSPSWKWDGNLEAPTLEPSLLTKFLHDGEPQVCHSYLRAGVFEFLNDSTHEFSGQKVPMPDLYEWVLDP